MSTVQPIRRLAVVNRGEAAMRCIRTVKSLRAMEGSDLRVIALYTRVDREAPYVRHADEAVALAPRATPVASYLDHGLLISTLQEARVDAVWPGWGFVAESPEFVERLQAAGIRFLGPSAGAMRKLGDKIASKKLAERLGIPVTPWSRGPVEDAADARRWVERLGLPLILKASAGGGGRGIRLVEALAQLPAQFQSARSEALLAFGDGRLFLEKMVRGGRHVEVQIVADDHGFLRSLGCRDCSVQRRHQKVIEEAPPVGLPPALLSAVQEAAVRLAREVGYSGVGTVEFLIEGGSFHFMEMNPRLQVEHGITEEITGLDLVELQLRVARGERLEGLEVREQGHCIQARVCAEDPDQGFLPAPGRIARFDPALGPSVRLDTGVTLGSVVPPAFDSLIAKVMARGASREQARSRLGAALRDFDLVIEGGATNKGHLVEVIESEDYKRAGVDTLWLDRWNAARQGPPEHAAEALVLAGILAYRAAWQGERRHFFAHAGTITPDHVPSLDGREIDLEYRGESYRLRVFSVGSWRYRVALEGRVVSARLGLIGPHAARLVMSGRYRRATYDLTDAYVQVAVESCVHLFGRRQAAGQVRAGAPSMVVAIDVAPGQEVEAGQHLGLLEAMKMEIAFVAPVSGIVTEVAAAKGQQVAAGAVLLVIAPSRESGAAAHHRERLRLPAAEEPLAALFTPGEDGGLGVPDLPAADRAPEELRSLALTGVRAEVKYAMLGWDVHPARFERVLELLEAPLPPGLSLDFRRSLAEVGQALIAFADVEQLFSRARRLEAGGGLGPSNNARLRAYLRRMRSQGAGIAPEFLEMLRAALRHYDIEGLDYSEDLERAVLRMFATQRDLRPRRRLVMAVLKRLMALVDSGITLSDDPALHQALQRIAALRGEISNALADTALDAHFRAQGGVEIARQAERTTRRLEDWLAAADGGWTPPPAEVLEDLALAPAAVFTRVQEWLRSPDPHKQAIALSAHVRRAYVSKEAAGHQAELVDGRNVYRARYRGRLVLAAACGLHELGAAARTLAGLAASQDALALELVAATDEETAPGAWLDRLREALPEGLPAERLTLSLVGPGGGSSFHTVARNGGGLDPCALGGLHPETAARIELWRYDNFELERLWSPPDIYCFHARARQEPDDEWLLVVGDVRARPARDGQEPELFATIFARVFQEASRALRLNLGARDPRRLLHRNRLVMHIAHPVVLDARTAQRMARGLLPNIRHLGVEETSVRLKLRSARRPQDPPREIEGVGSDQVSSRLELTWRRPRRQRLVPASPYQRKVAEARRRGLAYPYEVVRMLTCGDEARERVVEEGAEGDRRPVLPVGRFEEHDLAANGGPPRAVSVAGRPPGQNCSAVVFGIISTPTAKVPEGMRRVLILSDPTRGMGALAGPECDRVVAAIDLAERLSLPVEWVPTSSGALIAMDSGTENLDATARVVRRIVSFTQAGGAIHLIVASVNVGAQSYWDALATMLMPTRGALIMTPEGSVVLTGSAALTASGSVSGEDEVAIGGHERVMGPNGQARYFAPDLLSAYQLLYRHYDFTYVVPGEAVPRRHRSADPGDRDICCVPYAPDPAFGPGHDFECVGDLFDDDRNAGRKRPFSMRALMRAVIDHDGGHLEAWGHQVGAETAIVWEAHLGGHPVCLLGIESQNVPRLDHRPLDGPEDWNGGTLFPQSSKKLARAINAASGNRPVVILANLSGFDGSPESMRKLQLEYGAEIARAVVTFQGPMVFLVVSRYHGGAYVVFSRELNPGLRAIAVEGSYASVIGGGPAATVVFAREVRARVAADPRIEALRARLRDCPGAEERAAFDGLVQAVTLEKRAQVAAEFDSVHTVERARRVGSLEEIIPARAIRPRLVALLEAGAAPPLTAGPEDRSRRRRGAPSPSAPAPGTPLGSPDGPDPAPPRPAGARRPA